MGSLGDHKVEHRCYFLSRPNKSQLSVPTRKGQFIVFFFSCFSLPLMYVIDWEELLRTQLNISMKKSLEEKNDYFLSVVSG